MKVPVLETDEGPVRVPENAINNLLTRLHNAWKKGDMRWIHGKMRDNMGGYCMLGGLEHMSYEIAREERLPEEERRKLYRDSAVAVGLTLGSGPQGFEYAKHTIVNTNDRTWTRRGGMKSSLEAIRETIQKRNA